MSSCKSQRSSHALGRGTTSASIEECLPPEMVEAILGKLGRGNLRTACLVSRSFCAAASATISSLTLERSSQAMSLERFPRLEHVTLHHTAKANSLAEMDPGLRAVITHLRVSHGGDGVRVTLPELPGMPKLRELDINVHAEVDGARVVGADVLQRLTNLEALRIGDCTPSVAMTITTATWLTSLVMGPVTRPGEGWSAEFSWLQHATNLRKLQALQISVPHEALPLIGKLTGLTGLTWLGNNPEMLEADEACSIAPLSRLSRLRSLRIAPCISEDDLAIACSLGSGSLARLRIWVSSHASADCGRLLARQTALTRLRVCEAQLCNLRHMGGLRMELLQSLKLMGLKTVDAEGLDVLQRATSLTKLRIAMLVKQPDLRLSQTVGRLTQLR